MGRSPITIKIQRRMEKKTNLDEVLKMYEKPQVERHNVSKQKENNSLRLFREQFPETEMLGEGWYNLYTSKIERDNWTSSVAPNGKNRKLSQLTDWYSPNLDVFFDFKTYFSYLKWDSVVNYCHQVETLSVGKSSYILWYEIITGTRPKIQWYVINTCDLRDDIKGEFELIKGEEDWEYLFNPPTKDFGGWDSEWLQITHSRNDFIMMTRIIKRHRKKFEDVFHPSIFKMGPQ